MKKLLSTAVVLAAFSAPSIAQVQTPGSALMFPLIHNSGLFLEIISVTNTNATPFGSTLLKYSYYGAIPTGIPFQSNCVQQDVLEFLTPADTLSVSATCHNPLLGLDGYLVVSAADPASQLDWSFDYLVGSVMSIDGGTGLVYSYDPISIESPLQDGQFTDLDGDGQLDLDGLEYQAIADTLIYDSIFAFPNPELCLVNLTGSLNDINRVAFSAWNDNEMPFGFVLDMSCWMNDRVSVISLMFTDPVLASMPNDPSELDVTCDGIGNFETAWCTIQSIGVFNQFGQLIDPDGLLMGVVSNAPGARHLWGSEGLQGNGSLRGEAIKR